MKNICPFHQYTCIRKDTCAIITMLIFAHEKLRKYRIKYIKGGNHYEAYSDS